jgi:hypothetical protein
MSENKKKDTENKKSDKPKKPSLLRTGAKFVRKNPVAAAAGGLTAVFGGGIITTIAVGTAAGKAYKNREKIGEFVKDPSKIKDAVEDGIDSVKGAFEDAVDNAKEGFDEGAPKKDADTSMENTSETNENDSADEANDNKPAASKRKTQKKTPKNGPS